MTSSRYKPGGGDRTSTICMGRLSSVFCVLCKQSGRQAGGWGGQKHNRAWCAMPGAQGGCGWNLTPYGGRNTHWCVDVNKNMFSFREPLSESPHHDHPPPPNTTNNPRAYPLPPSQCDTSDQCHMAICGGGGGKQHKNKTVGCGYVQLPLWEF